MGGVLQQAFELIDDVDAATSAADAGRVFFAKLKALGFGAIFARSHSLSADDAREFIYYRETPKGWNDVYAQRGFARTNFVTRRSRRHAAPFVWSAVDVGEDRDAHANREMWRVLNDFGLRDGLAVPSHGPGYLGVISLAWPRFEHSDDLRRAIVLACH